MNSKFINITNRKKNKEFMAGINVQAMISALLIFAISLFMLFTSLPIGKEIASGEEMSINGKACYLVDTSTGTEMYSKNSDMRPPIASMVKIMTTLLAFEAVERGELSLDEMIAVSEESASMGGSQVFLDAGKSYKAGELMKSIVVASANDSCVAIAERLAGSVDGFVKDMNTRAKELNMSNTNFVNCTGLPAPESYSSAKDVSIMFRELIKHPVYFDYAGVWLEDFVHPDGRTTCMTNTNKLVRFYEGCDGGKTGFTNEAKFCLSATAERNGLRVVAVVIGADSSKDRFGAVSNLFGHAFANYSAKVIQPKDNLIDNSIRVVGGKKKQISIGLKDDLKALVKRGDEGEYQVHYQLVEKIKAPVKAGDVVGKALLTRNGEVISEYEIVSKEDIEKGNFFDLLKGICGSW
ncbi:MAG: D-alanyl-D-alanine carboxypeptidase [Clostridia bacterium]|nr:D-alanyl-D-alanine carboxypeptidase [Clostridia bacterium]